MTYKESPCGGDNTFSGHSIKIVLPPKPGQEGDEEYRNGIEEVESRLDVCALTLSSIAQDPNLPSSKLPFAWKLYEMLETVHKNKVDTDVVSWVDNGEAFKVHDLKRFVDEIVPIYFKQSKYKSFQRQLYFYGFTRETSSAGKNCHTPGSYRHPKFVRGKKTLCLSMAPKKTKKKRSNSPELGSSTDATNPANENIPQQQQQLQSHAMTVEPNVSVARAVSNEVITNSNDALPIPLLRDSSSTSTIQTKNGINYNHNKPPLEAIPQIQFQQQQNYLQRMQMEGFLRSLRQGERQNLGDRSPDPVPPAPTLQPCVSDGRACNIFGGTFHVVGKNIPRR
eukprot:CAMPEP_0197174734 /NCGR_PEP_ID=MMETSP1423-20130617/1130_1 /TAXON_ID=476441 /ORGANISM="Pseudo-nitzschia heimii, Strain UNC1101" /LENGTH=336 /DNA_ID=CAMNT_0042623697 /DNA_START=144 /DNA_END=1154 /DNA_ORIENTATION=-